MRLSNPIYDYQQNSIKNINLQYKSTNGTVLELWLVYYFVCNIYSFTTAWLDKNMFYVNVYVLNEFSNVAHQSVIRNFVGMVPRVPYRITSDSFRFCWEVLWVRTQSLTILSEISPWLPLEIILKSPPCTPPRIKTEFSQNLKKCFL